MLDYNYCKYFLFISVIIDWGGISELHLSIFLLLRAKSEWCMFSDTFKGLCSSYRQVVRQTGVRTLLYPGGRQTGWCRQVSGGKMLSLSGPAASASHNGETASWPGTGCMAAHWTTPGGRRQQYYTWEHKTYISTFRVTNWQRGSVF